MYPKISRNGEAVGYIRRAGFGYSIEKSLGTGYVDLPSENLDAKAVRDFIMAGHYQIDVMGNLHEAEVSLRPLFDPQKTKMEV